MTSITGARLRATRAAGAAAALLTLPAAAHAAEATDPPSPARTALRAPLAGHVTVAGQMLAAHRSQQQRRQRRQRRVVARRQQRLERVAVPPQLAAIAACESGGDPAAVDPSGTYRGKYQFDHATWASVGGGGDPAAASEAEQDMRAARLYARAGATPWPACGA
jgi:hypothetical protein